MVDEDLITHLLAISRQAHVEYRQNVARKEGQPGGQLTHVHGDPAAALRCVQRALDYRQQAHDADPSHSAGAWQAEPPTHQDHDQLIEFYRGVLSRG